MWLHGFVASGRARSGVTNGRSQHVGNAGDVGGRCLRRSRRLQRGSCRLHSQRPNLSGVSPIVGRGILVITESKLKVGKLTLGGTGTPVVGGVEFACQATNVRIAPTFNEEGDEVETLCGDKLSPDTKTTWNLQGTSIQDFDDPAGFVQYTWENNLTKTPFSWQPNENATVVSGTVEIRAVEMG